MTWAVALVALVGIVVVGSALARRMRVSAPLFLVLLGMAIGWLPVVPAFVVPPQVVLLGFLPPLLYAVAIRSSLVDLKTHKRGIFFLSVGHVVVVAVGIGLLLWWRLDIPLPLALAFGGVVAPRMLSQPRLWRAISVCRRSW